jgi:hypothetical protein
MKAKADKVPDQFKRFKNLARALVSVPKEEVKTEEERWRADRLKKKKPAV